MSKVAMSFMAHPDDAEMMCAGTLIRLRDLGWEIHMVSVTPGDCGTMTHTRWEIAAIRTKEAVAAAGVIGATYHCLDERDGLVVYDKATLQKAIDVFRRVAPSLVFTHSMKDYMMDHEMTALLARGASFMHGTPNASQFERLERSMVPAMYYCDAGEGVDALGEPVRPTTLVDISAVMEKKAEMLACHASQLQWLRDYHGIDEYIDSMKRHGADRGRMMGCAYAEGFVQHRGHAYVRDDVLGKLLGARTMGR